LLNWTGELICDLQSPGEDETSDGDTEDLLAMKDSERHLDRDMDDLGSGGSGNNGAGDDSNSGSPHSRDQRHTPTESDSPGAETDILARLRQQVHGLMVSVPKVEEENTVSYT
jgi:hypothetical protein